MAVFVLCADTEQQALELQKSRDLWRLRAEQGRLEPFPSVAEAEAYEYAPHEWQRVLASRARNVVGDPAQVKAGLEALAAQHDADEVVVLTITHDFAARVRSYELLAEAWELPAAA